MNIFNDIRNFINNNKTKIIICDNSVNIINYERIKDINNNYINVISDININIIGNDLKVIKMLDNELLIKGIIKEIHFNE